MCEIREAVKSISFVQSCWPCTPIVVVDETLFRV